MIDRVLETIGWKKRFLVGCCHRCWRLRLIKFLVESEHGGSEGGVVGWAAVQLKHCIFFASHFARSCMRCSAIRSLRLSMSAAVPFGDGSSSAPICCRLVSMSSGSSTLDSRKCTISATHQEHRASHHPQQGELPFGSRQAERTPDPRPGCGGGRGSSLGALNAETCMDSVLKCRG